MIDQLSDADLVAFRSRMLMASQRGYTVARSDEYMELLAEEAMADPPEGSEEGSAAHLYELANAALEARTGGGEKKAHHKKSEKAKDEKKVAPPPPPSAPAHKAKDEKKAEEHHAKKKSEPKVPASYDGWTKEELYAEAQNREIPNRSTMTKEELVEALEENDEEESK